MASHADVANEHDRLVQEEIVTFKLALECHALAMVACSNASAFTGCCAQVELAMEACQRRTSLPLTSFPHVTRRLYCGMMMAAVVRAFHDLAEELSTPLSTPLSSETIKVLVDLQLIFYNASAAIATDISPFASLETITAGVYANLAFARLQNAYPGQAENYVSFDHARGQRADFSAALTSSSPLPMVSPPWLAFRSFAAALWARIVMDRGLTTAPDVVRDWFPLLCVNAGWPHNHDATTIVGNYVSLIILHVAASLESTPHAFAPLTEACQAAVARHEQAAAGPAAAAPARPLAQYLSNLLQQLSEAVQIALGSVTVWTNIHRAAQQRLYHSAADTVGIANTTAPVALSP